MENEIVNWSKTLLKVYRYLGRITGALDKIFDTKMMSGSTMSSANINQSATLTEELIDITQRKITLINLKLITERVLMFISRDSARILVAKFIDGKSAETIAKMFDFTQRTTFRKVNSALKSFSQTLNNFGYNSTKLQAMLLNEKWILEVYKKLAVKNEEIKEFQEEYFSSLCREIKKQTLYA